MAIHATLSRVRPFGRYLILGATLVGVLVTAAPSLGQTADELHRASVAFDRGLEAQKRGQWAEAAHAFGQADEIVADPAALEAALAAVIQSDDAVLGMELAARADRNPYRDELARLAERTRRRFGPLVGRIVVHCEDCTVAIDGQPKRRGVASWVTIGAHRIALQVAGEEEHREVQVEPAGIVTIVPLGTRSKGSAEAADQGPGSPGTSNDQGAAASAGLSPAFFWVGLVLTGAAGGGAIASAVDTNNQHEAFIEAPTAQASIAGQNAETRTNIMVAVTAGLGVTTALLGLVAVDWGNDERLEGTLQLSPHGAGGRLTLRF